MWQPTDRISIIYDTVDEAEQALKVKAEQRPKLELKVKYVHPGYIIVGRLRN